MSGHRPGVSIGDRVRIRGERWRVVRLTHHADCSIADVSGIEASNRGTTTRFLLPFDVADSLPQRSEMPRVVRKSVLRIAVRRALSEAAPRWSSLRAAARADVVLLPFQLEPAIAMNRGLGSRFLLADDVGLGKTIEAGLMLAEILVRDPEARALVVVPAALCAQWRDELQARFGISADLFDAAGVARAAARFPAGTNPWRLSQVIVTSIDFVKRADVIRALETLVWDLMIFDEAHALAGRSDRAAAAALLARRGRHVALLSATPHSGDEPAFQRLCSLGSLPADRRLLMFRRSRVDVGCASRRRVRMLRIEPTDAELRMYQELTAYGRAVWRRAPEEFTSAARLAITVLTRRACSSAASLELSVHRRLEALSRGEPEPPWQMTLPLQDDTAGDGVPDGAVSAPGLPDVGVECAWLERIAGLAKAAATAESKIAALKRVLSRVREPVIVFTDYRDTLNTLLLALGVRDACQLHGGMDARERAAAIHRFTAGDTSLLLATDAASEGLNLHHRCRLVVNLEVPWTPARLEQRAGRVDRLGQRRRAHALTLVARGTLEQHIVAPRLLERLQRSWNAAPFVDAGRFHIDALGEEAFGDAIESPTVVSPELPDGVARATLTPAAVEEASRLRTTIRLGVGLPSRLPPQVRPPAGCFRLPNTDRSRIYLALRLLFVDNQEEVVWETIGCPTMTVPAPPRRCGDGCIAEWLHHTIHQGACELAAAAAHVHDRQYSELLRELTAFAERSLERERAIVTSIRTDDARLAASLVQPGLFDRRVLRRADAQRRLLDHAIAASNEHVTRLERLSCVKQGGRLLAFAAVAAR